jgi:hypothetical protein
MDVIEHSTYDAVCLNVRGLDFFSGHTVNDCAIEQLLRFVCYFSQGEKRIQVLLDDGCVKDALKKDLEGRRLGAVNISDAQPLPAMRSQTVGRMAH